MAAARRYAIAGYDRTGLARTMYTRPLVGTFIAVMLAAFFALFMYAGHGPQGGEVARRSSASSRRSSSTTLASV